MSASYRLTGRVESGDLAELYEALQLPAGDVAVKLFHPKTSDPAYARDLADTARALQGVRHPGILHVVDLGFVRQRLAVVRQDVDGFMLGTALHRLTTKEVILPAPVALYIVIQLLEAVQLAHDAGVVHGALTPGNLLLSRDGVPAVCDFGALRALLAVPQLKKSFAHRGRSAYRALEVARGEDPTVQSDIYSLGAIAYELLTLREAVVPGSGVSTRRESLPPPSRLDRRINARLDPIILRALDSTPQRRFRSCGEFAAAIRNFLSASGGMPGPDEVRRFVGELFPNEVSLATLGPVPFHDAFALEPVSGAEMDDVHAEELEASIVQRAPYSRPLSETEAAAETQDSATPAFEEYRPEDYEPQPAPEPPRAAARQPQPPVGEGEGTDPGSAGPLEKGWEAPPGAAPPKPRRQLVPLGGPQGQQPTRMGARNPRVKVVEDFAHPLPPEDDEELSIFGRRAAARAAGRAPAPRAPLETLETPAVSLPTPFPERSERKERHDVAEPARSGIALPPPSSGHRRLLTEELSLSEAARKRRRLAAIAGAIALVGVFSFALAAWRLGGSRTADTEESATSESDSDATPPSSATAVAPPGATPEFGHPAALRPVTPPVEAPAPPMPREEVEDDDAPEYTAPSKAQRAFLSLRTNVPANVYIDGARVSRRTPLVRFPVKSGSRRIRVVAVSTGEDKEFALRFTRGQHQKLEEHFQAPRR